MTIENTSTFSNIYSFYIINSEDENHFEFKEKN